VIMNNGGVITRVSSFDRSQHEPAIAAIFERTARHETFPKFLERSGLTDVVKQNGERYIYGFEGLEWWKVVDKFVTQYVNAWYADDAAVNDDEDLCSFFKVLAELWKPVKNSELPSPGQGVKAQLIDFISTHVWMVTGLHEQIHAADYVAEGDIFAPWIDDGSLDDYTSLLPCVEDNLLALYVYLLVDMPSPPLYQDFSKFMPNSKEIIDSFMADMRQLHDDMVKRNRERVEKHWIFDPYAMCITVTV